VHRPSSQGEEHDRFIIVTIVCQAIGFAISRAVDYQYPAAGLMTFLIFFLGAFYLAWPIAVFLFDKVWGTRRRRGEDEETATARLAGKPLEYQRDLDRRTPL
jgi:uncharacterized membrane protein